jgi:hypothetical protein
MVKSDGTLGIIRERWVGLCDDKRIPNDANYEFII